MVRVNICRQCGDIGFKDALIYCTKCESAPRHSYCMDEVPEDLTAEIYWLCEDCRMKSPDSTSKARFTKTSRTLDHDPRRAPIGSNGHYRGIGSVNDHLVNDSIANVRVDSSLNMDSHVSLGCITSGAPNTVSSSSCFKVNENTLGESCNEKLRRKGLMLRHRDKVGSRPLVDAQGTNNQFSAKRFPDNSVESFNTQEIGQRLNCEISGLKSLAFFGLKEDEEFGRWKLRGRRAKRRRSILPSKGNFDNIRPLIDGKDTKSYAVERIPKMVSSSSCFKLNEGGMMECSNEKPEGETFRLLVIDKSIPPLDLEGTNIQFEAVESKKGKLKRRSFTIPTEEDLDNFHPLVDGEDTTNSFAVKKIPGIEPFVRDVTEQTTNNDTKTLSTVRSSACSERSIPPAKEQPVIDGECASSSFTYKKIACTSIKPFDNKSLKSSSSCGINASGAGTSSCIEFERGQVEEKVKEKSLSRLTAPGMNAVDAIHPPIESQSASIMFRAEKLSGPSIEASENQGIVALGTLKSSSCFRPREGEIKDHHAVTPPKGMIPLSKGESDKFAANKVPGIFHELTDKHIIKGALTCCTLGAIRSSTYFELEEAEIDRYCKEKPKSGRLILRTEDDLNSLHLVIDSRGTSIMITDKRLPDTFVAASDSQTIQLTDMKDQTKFPYQHTLHSVPMSSHVWSGTFTINKGEFCSLSAYPSNKACEKVLNLARNMPPVLQMQKLPRLVAWPNSFKVSSPTDDNIALYFSPVSIRFESVVDELVDDLINNDLMLRSQFDEAELLVFSSFVLPQDHQRLQGKYYAWGVFKRRSAPAASNGAAEEHQMEESLKHGGGNEVKDHVEIILKDCEEEKLQEHGCMASVYAERLRHKEECREELAEEKIERVDMVSSRGRSKDSVGGIEHQSEPKKPGNVRQFTEEKQHGTVLHNLRRILKSYDSKLAAEQPSDCEKLGEGNEMPKKLPETSPDIEEGEVCDDECFDDSQNGEPACLELFPLHVENIGTAFGFGAMGKDDELKLGLVGLPTLDDHHGA